MSSRDSTYTALYREMVFGCKVPHPVSEQHDEEHD